MATTASSAPPDLGEYWNMYSTTDASVMTDAAKKIQEYTSFGHFAKLAWHHITHPFVIKQIRDQALVIRNSDCHPLRKLCELTLNEESALDHLDSSPRPDVYINRVQQYSNFLPQTEFHQIMTTYAVKEFLFSYFTKNKRSLQAITSLFGVDPLELRQALLNEPTFKAHLQGIVDTYEAKLLAAAGWNPYKEYEELEHEIEASEKQTAKLERDLADLSSRPRPTDPFQLTAHLEAISNLQKSKTSSIKVGAKNPLARYKALQTEIEATAQQKNQLDKTISKSPSETALNTQLEALSSKTQTTDKSEEILHLREQLDLTNTLKKLSNARKESQKCSVLIDQLTQEQKALEKATVTRFFSTANIDRLYALIKERDALLGEFCQDFPELLRHDYISLKPSSKKLGD